MLVTILQRYKFEVKLTWDRLPIHLDREVLDIAENSSTNVLVIYF